MRPRPALHETETETKNVVSRPCWSRDLNISALHSAINSPKTATAFEHLNVDIFVQTINILIVNQSIVDMCASFFTLLTATVEMDGTRMSRDSIYDQFVCHIWLARQPLFILLATSIYGILLMALDRYIAVIYPIWQKNNVRTGVCW